MAPDSKPATDNDDFELRFEAWFDAAEQRQLESLRFAEIRRAIQALSKRYIFDQRDQGPIRAFDGAGKRAAFALYFTPLHLLTVREIAIELQQRGRGTLLDLGCGSGAASLGWALGCTGTPLVEGVDQNGWACDEAQRNWRKFGLKGRARRQKLAQLKIGKNVDTILLGWAVNELDASGRDELLQKLEAALRDGAALCVIEPISKKISPWWDSWCKRLERFDPRVDEWRFNTPLPRRLAEYDRAAGLDHRERTARSLFVGDASARKRARRRLAQK